MSTWLYDVRQAIVASWRRAIFTALYAALAFTACGIYAVSVHASAERSRELGIRAALGASPRGLVALVLRTDFEYVVLGIGAGLIIARLAASAMRGLLYDVGAAEPGPYLIVALLPAAVAGAACHIPAARAARIESGACPARLTRRVQTKGRHIGPALSLFFSGVQ
jgi:ABC-type lipoprotein release transport system permease subunit